MDEISSRNQLDYRLRQQIVLRGRKVMNRTTDDLVRIATAGAGLILDSDTKSTEELTKIARAAAESEVMLIIRNVGNKTTDELVEIAGACEDIVFEL
jgi:hypothetical protein